MRARPLLGRLFGGGALLVEVVAPMVRFTMVPFLFIDGVVPLMSLLVGKDPFWPTVVMPLTVFGLLALSHSLFAALAARMPEAGWSFPARHLEARAFAVTLAFNLLLVTLPAAAFGVLEKSLGWGKKSGWQNPGVTSWDVLREGLVIGGFIATVMAALAIPFALTRARQAAQRTEAAEILAQALARAAPPDPPDLPEPETEEWEFIRGVRGSRAECKARLAEAGYRRLAPDDLAGCTVEHRTLLRTRHYFGPSGEGKMRLNLPVSPAIPVSWHPSDDGLCVEVEGRAISYWTRDGRVGAAVVGEDPQAMAEWFRLVGSGDFIDGWAPPILSLPQ